MAARLGTPGLSSIVLSRRNCEYLDFVDWRGRSHYDRELSGRLAPKLERPKVRHRLTRYDMERAEGDFRPPERIPGVRSARLRR